MNETSRRSFLGTAAVGAFSVGNFSGCGNPEPDTQVDKKTRLYPLDGITRENIKITDIKATALSYKDPNENLWRSGRMVVWKTDASLCEVFTDQGIVGIGGGSPYGNPERMKEYTEEVIKPLMIGKNPFDVDFLTIGGGSPYGNPACSAWAGVNTACWDIIGKAKNMPVYKLLATDNEPQTHILLYASAGDEHAWYEDGQQQLIDEALRYKELGFNAFKFRPGTDWEFSNMTLKKYIPIMRKLREAVGPDFKLIHEATRIAARPDITFDQIVNEFCPVLEELHFYWYEEPITSYLEGDVERHLQIKEALPTVMVSGGESKVDRFEFKEYIDSGAFDIIQPDTGFTGISEGWHIARMGHLRGRLLCPHNWHGGLTTMSNAHLAAGLPNLHRLETNMTFNPLKEEVFKEPYVVKNGYMDVPDKPGFGVEIIDDIEKKFPWVPGTYSKPNPVMSKG